MIPTNNHDSNQPTNNPQGETMEDTTNNTTPQILRWTKPDGTSTLGTLDEIGAGYHAAGGSRAGHKLTAAFTAPDVTDLLEEDTEDEATEEVTARAPLMVTPSITVGQREPVTVAPRSVEDTKAAHEAAKQLIRRRGAAGELESTWFPPGTKMLNIGSDTFRAKARRHGELGTFREEAAPIIEQVRGEDRRDTGTLNLADLRINEDLAVFRKGSGLAPLPLEWMGLQQLIARASKAMPGPLGRMIDVLPRGEFVDLVNRQLERADSFKLDNTGQPMSTDVKIQTRVVEGQRQGFSVVSPSFMAMPLDRILGAYASELDRMANDTGIDPRGEIRYNPQTTQATFRATWHAPEEFQARVGDPIEVGIKGSTGGAGNSGHNVDSVITLIRCINCTLMTWAAAELRRRHSGGVNTTTGDMMQRIRRDVQTATQGMRDGIETFGGLWGILRDTPIDAVALAGAKHDTVEDALAAMVKKGQITKEVARDALLESLLSAFDKEPGNTAADLVNAVTRAAHEGMLDDIQQWKLERAAGDMMVTIARKAAPQQLKALALPGVR